MSPLGASFMCEPSTCCDGSFCSRSCVCVKTVRLCFAKRCRLDDVRPCCWKPWSAVRSKTRASHGYPYKGNGYPSIGWMGCMCIQGCYSTSLGCNQWFFEFLLPSYGFQPVCPVPTMTTFNITSVFLFQPLPHSNALKMHQVGAMWSADLLFVLKKKVNMVANKVAGEFLLRLSRLQDRIVSEITKIWGINCHNR